jgi:hypothetical protein
MRVITTMGEAFVNATAKNPKHWVGKQVVDRAQHTHQGTKEVHPITVHCSPYTRAKIARDLGVTL